MKRNGSKYHRTVSRRDFLREAGALAGVAAGFTALGLWNHSDEPLREEERIIHHLKDFRVEPSVHPQLVVARGSEPAALVRAAVERLGGIRRFIQPGDRVLLKPNVGWDRLPEQAANTNPELVAAVAALCREARAAEVRVSDVSLNDPQRCFTRSGIRAAAEAAGAEVALPGGGDFLETDMGGELLTLWPVSRYFHEADKVINLPVVKHHSLCGCTLAMKNWYGVLGGQRNRLHQEIHTSIVDLAAAVRPTLTVMDATRILLRNGPTGGNLADVREENTVIAGLDEVAIDAYSLQFLGLEAAAVPYLAMGEARGLGRVAWRELAWDEIQLG